MSAPIRRLMDLSIHGLLQSRAQRAPEAVAINAPARDPLTYSRLLFQVEQTTEALSRMGLGKNARIAIVLPNGPEMAVASLAVSACATSIPLNPAYRVTEFDGLLSGLRASALMVQAGVDSPAIQAAERSGLPVIRLAPRLDAEAGIFGLEGRSASPPVASEYAGDQDVALILPTSGTTARSKIVPLTHANICSSAHNIARTLELSDEDRCLNVMPLFHIHGLVGALLASLASGGSVTCGAGSHAPSILEWLTEFRATWYTAVPTIHQVILERAWAKRGMASRCRLRFVRSCSAPLPRRVLAELEATFGSPVIEAYGMTEASHQITSNPLPPGVRKPGSVGVPVGVQVAAVNPAGDAVSPGATGEIVICGPNVTAGYEGDAEANRNSHVAGWLRTGDQGYLDDEGYLFLTGRLKEVINRAGAKIAPAEVDTVLLEHPAVAEAVTFALPHPTLGEEVAAAVVLQVNSFAAELELREFAANQLAQFKVPSRVLIVEAIPKGPTGKVQRTGLGQRLGLAPPNEAMPQLRAEFVAPHTVLEKELATMWAEVLAIQRIGVHDDFFEVGGDSLLGTELFLRVRESLQVTLSLTQLFEIPTIAAQALTIGRSQRGVTSRFSVAIQSAGARPPFFCVVPGTNIALLRNLGILFAPDQPLYALYPGHYAKAGLSYSPAKAIAEYVTEIRAVQPEGPYLLGGWCAGGGIALEVARRLIAQGQSVATVALIAPVLYGRFNHDFRSYWRSLSPLTPREKLRRILLTLRSVGGDALEEIGAGTTANAVRAGAPDSRSLAVASLMVQRANRRAFRKYTRRAYPGRVSLFLTRDSISAARPPLDAEHVLGRIATGGLDVHPVSGDHASVDDLHVEELAKQLRQCLDKAVIDLSTMPRPRLSPGRRPPPSATDRQVSQPSRGRRPGTGAR